MKLFLLLAALVGGAGFSQNTAHPGNSYRYDLTFQGEARATIDLKGDGKSILECFLYDEKASLIVSDVGAGDTFHFTLVPKAKTTFIFVVKNTGNNYDKYTLIAD